MKTLGRRRWKQASGYHHQGWVENTFFQYKSIIGDGVRPEFPILSLNPGLRHRCVALGVWPPGATDAVRVQGTHLIPLSPGASTAITELQFGGAPEAAPPPPSGHGRGGTTSVPRASAPPDARTAGPAPALLHEYPLRVGQRGPHFSGPSAGATLLG